MVYYFPEVVKHIQLPVCHLELFRETIFLLVSAWLKFEYKKPVCIYAAQINVNNYNTPRFVCTWSVFSSLQIPLLNVKLPGVTHKTLKNGLKGGKVCFRKNEGSNIFLFDFYHKISSF